MLVTVLAILVEAPSRPAVFDKYPHFLISDNRFFVTYQPGGRTKQQAWQKVDNYTANETVIFVCNGGYFAPNARPIVAVDLVISKGVELSPYRFDLSRPILALGSGKAAIFAGGNGEAYAKYVKYRAEGGYENAIAGDYQPIDPTRRTWRRIVGIRGNELVIITLKFANLTSCQKEITEQQLEQWIYLDGGSSVPANAVVPAHFVVLQQKNDLDG